MEGDSALTIRKRLLNPPNAVPDPGIDLKRRNPPPQLPEPLQEPSETVQPETQKSSSNILLFTPHSLTPRLIIWLVAKRTGFTPADILGPSRKYNLTFARHAAIWLCIKHFPKRSLPYLGTVFNRDHTSIINARDRMRRYADSSWPEGIRLSNLICLIEEDIRDCCRPSQTDFSEPAMEIGQQESIQEP